MIRRAFLHIATASAAAAMIPKSYAAAASDSLSSRPPAFSVIPVVGDGKWIWTEPPQNQKGYLEPRPFELSIGIELQGKGKASGILASTPVPLELPEQKIEDLTIKAEGCAAEVRRLAPEAGQLFLVAEGIEKGQTITAQALYKLT